VAFAGVSAFEWFLTFAESVASGIRVTAENPEPVCVIATVRDSPADSEMNERSIETVTDSPSSTVVADGVPTVRTSSTTAVEGDTESAPNPNATTSASAMRLKLVFVDISFLSKVVPETFSSTADKDRVFVS
jgi:hypothetical protein